MSRKLAVECAVAVREAAARERAAVAKAWEAAERERAAVAKV